MFPKVVSKIRFFPIVLPLAVPFQLFPQKEGCELRALTAQKVFWETQKNPKIQLFLGKLLKSSRILTAHG
jgi:hypothetical protein